MSVSRGKVGNSQHFPTNLHVLLDEAEKGNHSHIVSWCLQGQAFKIHDQDALVPLLAKYFRQTKFKSFLRQLQSYDFHRTTRKGCDKGVVSHPLFVRGRRSLCFRMSRKQSQTLPPKSPSSDINMNTNINMKTNSCYPAEAVPSNETVPLRKINSAPVFGAKRNRVATNLSDMNNEMFHYEEEEHSLMREGMEPSLHHNEHQHEQNQNQNQLMGEGGDSMMRKSCSAPQIGERSRFKRRASASATMAMSTHDTPYAKPQMKRPSASAILLSNEQRESIIQCANIDYSSSTNNVGRIPHENFILPHEAFLMSIKESSAADGVVTTSQSQMIPSQIVQSTNQQLQQQQQTHQVQQQQQQNCEQPVQYQVQLAHQQQQQQQSQVQQMQQIVEQIKYQPQAKVDQQVQEHHQQQVQPQQVHVQHVQYLQEQQQQQQQQQQQVLQLQQQQQQPQHQIEQVQMQHRQDNQQVYAQYQQEPQQQHQIQQVEDQYRQESQQQQIQSLYGQHQVPNQVQQVKQPIEQMSYAQQQLKDHYLSACQVQQIQQQQQQQQQYSSQNQNQNVQYQRSQCEQQEQDQNKQVENQQRQYGQQLARQHQHCEGGEQQQDSQQYQIAQNQQEIHQCPQQQVREFMQVQNSPVEPQQLSSTGFSNSGCRVHPGSPVRSHQSKPQEQARQFRHLQNSHVEPQPICPTGFSDSSCHVLPGSPVRSYQLNPSKGNQEMLPASLAMCSALSSNESDVSFSSTKFKSCGNDNNNGSNDLILPALKFSTSYQSRGVVCMDSIGNPPLSSSSYPIDKIKIAGTTNMVNNHSNTVNNHQDVALPDISLSASQHTAHTISTMSHSNCNDEYRTMLQLPASETVVPQHNTITAIAAASPFLSQQYDQQQAGGFLKADIASLGCTQPHSSDVAITAAPSFNDGGTVDSLLLLNGGGCEEWEMSFEDFKGI